jgi:hypothetical protein
MNYSPENTQPHIESPEKLRLLELEKEDRWVFHGSPTKLEKLTPRQAYTYPDKSRETKIADGEPAVFASPIADIAIFMAVVNGKNAPKGSRSGFGASGEDQFKYRATKETLDQLHNVKGYVFVFNKDKFTPRSQTESCAYSEVIPDEIIEVTENDLPDISVEDF